jgi:hypothetical protein
MQYDEDTIARFWSKVSKRGSDDCWEWSAGCDEHGYGRFRLNRPRRVRRAHIVSYELSTGPAKGLFICHSCDNPPCCNPRHLWRGSHDDNMADMVVKCRSKAPPSSRPGVDNANARLTDDDVMQIKRMIARGEQNIVIAPLFGVTHSMVSRIKLGKAWTHITIAQEANLVEAPR